MGSSVESILRQAGAYSRGHYVLAAEGHSPYYINAAALLADPIALGSVAWEMAEKLANMPTPPQFIVCPAEAAIPLCTLITAAYNDETTTPILGLYASKVEGAKGEFEFKRGQGDLVRGRHGIVLDDLGTSGRSVKKVVDLTRANGGEVVAVHYLVIRGQDVTTESVGGVPELWAPLVLDLPEYSAADCPLCADGVPINTNLGHGAAYVAEHGQPVKRT